MMRGLVALVAVFLAACGPNTGTLPGDRQPGCPAGCPDGQKCHFSDGRCILSGIAQCLPDCGQQAQCSADYPQATCVLQRCDFPSTWRDGTLKLASLRIAMTEDSCDLTGDGKPDNQLARLLTVFDVNKQLAASVAADQATILLEPESATWGQEGQPFGVHLLFGTLAPASMRCQPDNANAFCTYTVSRLSYEVTSIAGGCAPWVRFDGLTPDATRTSVRTSDQGQMVDMAIPVDKGVWLLQLLAARLEGTLSQAVVTGPGLGPQVEGRICAAIPKGDILRAIESLPAETLSSFGGAESAKLLIDLALPADIDIDADGKPESVSGALRWTAIPARITGYSP
jgi:hypothetical protein